MKPSKPTWTMYLRGFMRRHNLKQGAMAKLCGVTQPTISAWLKRELLGFPHGNGPDTIDRCKHVEMVSNYEIPWVHLAELMEKK